MLSGKKKKKKNFPTNKTNSNLDLEVVASMREENHVFFLPGLCVVRFDPSSGPPSLASQLQGHLVA